MWVCVCLYIHINKHKMHINWNVPKVGAVGRFMVCRRGGLQLSQVLMETEYGQYGVCRYEKKVYRGHWRVRIAWSTIIIDCTSCNSMRRVCGRFQVQVPTGTKFTYQKKKRERIAWSTTVRRFLYWEWGLNNQSLSRLNWILVSESWENHFSGVLQSILPKPVSDHSPSLLDRGGMRSGASPFRFKNMWLEAEGFKDLLKRWWTGYNFRGSYSLILAAKLKALKSDLKRWKNMVFGNVSIRKE